MCSGTNNNYQNFKPHCLFREKFQKIKIYNVIGPKHKHLQSGAPEAGETGGAIAPLAF